jgi:hypothetical protein
MSSDFKTAITVIMITMAAFGVLLYSLSQTGLGAWL